MFGFIKHFPMIQPIIHLSYVLEFQLLDEALQNNYSNYIRHIDKFTNKNDVNHEYDDYDNSCKKAIDSLDQMAYCDVKTEELIIPKTILANCDRNAIFKFAKINDDIKKQKTFLQTEFMDMKLFETFLEGGPQSILQIAIFIMYGPADYWQYVTIATSLLSFCFSSTYMYLQYPTKVKLIIDIGLICTNILKV